MFLTSTLARRRDRDSTSPVECPSVVEGIMLVVRVAHNDVIVQPDVKHAGQRTDGLTTDEREELRRLRRENKTLREEREILKKAAAWFAKETGSIPSRDSSS